MLEPVAMELAAILAVGSISYPIKATGSTCGGMWIGKSAK
jgi:hypothetical protein